jgi:hypothetical protein
MWRLLSHINLSVWEAYELHWRLCVAHIHRIMIPKGTKRNIGWLRNLNMGYVAARALKNVQV